MSLMWSSAIHDPEDPHFHFKVFIINTDYEMADLCFYYNQLSNLTVVEVRDIPPSTSLLRPGTLRLSAISSVQALFLKNGYVDSIL